MRRLLHRRGPSVPTPAASAATSAAVFCVVEFLHAVHSFCRRPAMYIIHTHTHRLAVGATRHVCCCCTAPVRYVRRRERGFGVILPSSFRSRQIIHAIYNGRRSQTLRLQTRCVAEAQQEMESLLRTPVYHRTPSGIIKSTAYASGAAHSQTSIMPRT